MADRDQLYTALRNADAAGDVEGARKLAAYIKSMLGGTPAAPAQPEKSFLRQAGDAVVNTGAGVLRGVKDVIDTGAQGLASGFDALTGSNEGQRVRSMNAAGDADFKREYGDSTAADIGRIGGNVLATLQLAGFLAQEFGPSRLALQD